MTAECSVYDIDQEEGFGTINTTYAWYVNGTWMTSLNNIFAPGPESIEKGDNITLQVGNRWNQ